MSFASGALVRARGREWVVLPESEPDLLVLRPLGGADGEIAGVLPALESVEPARFAPPDPALAGDARSAGLLRDALRLGFRSSAGPFRSFGRIAVDPRPYQLVPLLMALPMDPVRLLIADDVGVGKTVEAALIARELLDQGTVARLAVLCPPHLAEQWQRELREKFHIEAEVVLSSTARRLERGLGVGESLFDVHPFVVVSTEYIKADRRRAEFVRSCPELVIVDEAHGFAWAGPGGGRARQQRHELLIELARDPERHLVLVTATPHSGKADAFRSLLAFLGPGLAELPEELGGAEREADRRRLARHLVQRRRADIRHFMKDDTPFPDRMSKDETYRLTPDQRALLDRVLEFARETVHEPGTDTRRQRIRWWSALGLLRALGSSPRAAAATLLTRAAAAGAETPQEIDALGRRVVLDVTGEDETAEASDVVPGADADIDGDTPERRRLRAFAREAAALEGDGDAKLQGIVPVVRRLVDDGDRPIVFCRFIATAEYVAEHLRAKLRGVEVVAVTGSLPPPEREARVAELAEHPRRVLVATDCLSEGINLQEHFDAVVHYDLAWNPTRHEQREGRVDRFGQRRPSVRVVTYYGADNPVDGVVLDVLLRKHDAIRATLGVSVPVPVESDTVMEAILEGMVTRGAGAAGDADQLALFERDVVAPRRRDLHEEWDSLAERERRSRTMFAHEGVRAEDVYRELQDVQRAIGVDLDVRRFCERALTALSASVDADRETLTVELSETPIALRDALGGRTTLRARFRPPSEEGEELLMRTHPVVEGLASHVLDTALDAQSGESVAARCGVMRAHDVTRRTTALLLRMRFHLTIRRGDDECRLLAEDARVLAFAGSADAPEWLSEEAAEALLSAAPSANVPLERARRDLERAVEALPTFEPALADVAQVHAAELLESHRRVRHATGTRGRFAVEPQLPVDVLGLYVFLPHPLDT